jgi:Methyltransferase small domain
MTTKNHNKNRRPAATQLNLWVGETLPEAAAASAPTTTTSKQAKHQPVKQHAPVIVRAPHLHPQKTEQPDAQRDTSGILALLDKREPVASNVLDILKRAYFESEILLLPPRLDRKDYEAVNKAIERIGGKWNRRAKGHVFEDEEDPRQLLQLILETGEMPGKNPTAFYGTSQGLAARIAEGIPADARAVLEPSAGTGAIARAIRDYCTREGIDARLDCVEVLPKFAAKLREQGFTTIEADFLSYEPERRYDVILMNPPYSLEGDSLAYVAHVMHAWAQLAEGGMLRAIVPAGFAFHQDRRIKELRDLVEKTGTWEELPNDSFKASGTGVKTILLEMMKPPAAAEPAQEAEQPQEQTEHIGHDEDQITQEQQATVRSLEE